MKRMFLSTLGILLVFSCSCASAQELTVNLNMVSPMPARISEWQRNPSLITAVVLNNTVTPLQSVAFSFVIRDLAANQVVASSKDKDPAVPRFTIPPGASTFNGASIINVNAVDINPSYRTIATTTGSLPEGQYELCIRLLGANGVQLDATGRLCAGCIVILPDPPTLLRPADGDSIVKGTFPQFAWTPVQLGGAAVFYDLKITPLFAGQDARYAIDHNEALLSRRLTTTVYQYLPSDPPFSFYPSAIRFAWQVQAVSDTGTPVTRNDGKSDIYWFNTTTQEKTVAASQCQCTCSPAISPGPKDTLWHYAVGGSFECTGTWGSGPDRYQCEKKSVKYKWYISVGADVATIVGPNEGASVGLKPLKPGSCVLHVTVTVVCNDGTTCTNDASAEIEVPKIPTTKDCSIIVEEKMEPPMDGGLDPKYLGKKTVHRDDFVPLKAVGVDYDKLIWKCEPGRECPDTKSEKTIPLTGRVRFEWSIQSGEGQFVQLGCLPESLKSGVGDCSIFQPPYVPLPDRGPVSKTTTIKLLVIDDNDTQPKDKTVERTVTIVTSRNRTNPDFYDVEVKSDTYKLPGIPKDPPVNGTCQAVGPTWELDTDLKVPEISKPEVTDNDKVVVGQWIILNANDQRDNDKLTLNCVSQKCNSTSYSKLYEDNVAWKWKVVSGGARFVTGLSAYSNEWIGRYAIVEAPQSLPDKVDKVDVVLSVEVHNPDALKKEDKKPDTKKITLNVYRAGVKMELTLLAWLPEEGNRVEKKSYLVYKDGGAWLPALAHMGRIHFFELKEVSKEKGLCLNAPPIKEANQCRDLLIKDEGDHEAFNDKGLSGDCKKKDYYYQEARTKRPVKEYTINVYSEDYGAYGFIYSLANVNKHSESAQKSERPYYESVPLKKSDVTHPSGRGKRREYADNRVTMPRDEDENHIADGGWKAEDGTVIPDPVSNDDDEDDTPTGDKYKGDGLTAYEEYRGFKISSGYIRTNTLKKSLFVYNQDDLPMGTFQTLSELEVYRIDETQFDSRTHTINFLFGTAHETDQRGLVLRDGHTSTRLLGIANTTTGNPAPPNWVRDVVVYKTKIATFSSRMKLDEAAKLNQVIAHELSHAVNVYHHGEGDPDVENSYNRVHGLRSGNIECIMRYDNIGSTKEDIGTILCTSRAGTGSNAGNGGFGDAANGRGDCKGQIRVSGKSSRYPTR